MTREDADHKLQIAKTCVPDAFLRYREYAARTSVQSPPSAIPSNAQSSLAFRQGQADRQDWESWLATLSGEYRAGAEHWAAHRSTPNPRPCNAVPPSAGADWTAGCFAAQQRLAHAGVRRKTEPEYCLGWNNPETGTLTASTPADAPPRMPQPVYPTLVQTAYPAQARPVDPSQAKTLGIIADPIMRSGTPAHRTKWRRACSAANAPGLCAPSSDPARRAWPCATGRGRLRRSPRPARTMAC